MGLVEAIAIVAIAARRTRARRGPFGVPVAACRSAARAAGGPEGCSTPRTSGSTRSSSRESARCSSAGERRRATSPRGGADARAARHRSARPAGDLREQEPVSWVPVLDGWLVTRRDLCIEVMRDADLFTVDDPRFSTAQVVGPSMLSLDGDEHQAPSRPVRRRPAPARGQGALHADRGRGGRAGWSATLAPKGRAEVRRDLAGPLAVNVVAAALDLLDAEPGDGPRLVRRDRRGGRSGFRRRRGRSAVPGTPSPPWRITSAGPSTTATGCLADATATLDAGRGRLERRGDDVRRASRPARA